MGVAVSAIQLPGALASIESSAAGATVVEERGAETRSTFPFFTLSTVFHVFSTGAYSCLTKTPEYREIKGDHGTRRASISMPQSFTAEDEAGLVSGQSRGATSSLVSRTIAMVKANLPFTFAVAWVFVATPVRGKNGGI